MGKHFLRFIYREKFSINQGLKIVVIPKKIGGSVQRIAPLLIAFRQYRTNELVRRRMNFSSDAMADFEGLLEVNRKICQQQMAEKASPTLPTNCAVLPLIFLVCVQLVCADFPKTYAIKVCCAYEKASLKMKDAAWAYGNFMKSVLGFLQLLHFRQREPCQYRHLC